MIRVATRADVPALAAALARAFDDDPLAEFAHPRAASRGRRLAWYFGGRLRTLVDEELCFCDEARTGAALWAPPDRWEVPPEEGRRLGRLVNHRTPQLLVSLVRMQRLHPREPHLYLSVLGVSPEGQGRGLGSALLAPVLERCDREGVPAYLESSKESNLSFYERHGFRVTGETGVPFGPRLWTMWRDPR